MKRYFLFGCVLIFVGLVSVAVNLCYGILTVSRQIQSDELFTRNIVESAGGADAVLTACRQLADLIAPSENQLYCDVPITDNRIPPILRSLRLRAVQVSRDDVLIVFDEPGHRSALNAFRAGAAQYGTTMITNDLWYWNGTPSKETRKVFLERSEVVKSSYKK